MCCNQMADDIPSDMWQPSCTGEKLCSLSRKMRQFRELLVKMHDDRCRNGSYIAECDLLDQIIEELQRLGTLSASDSSPYQQAIVYIKREFRSTS